MKIILTVTGIDHEGIIAAVTNTLAERHVNVLDVSQTIMGEYFTMIMHCSFDENEQNLIDLQEAMQKRSSKPCTPSNAPKGPQPHDERQYPRNPTHDRGRKTRYPHRHHGHLPARLRRL